MKGLMILALWSVLALATGCTTVGSTRLDDAGSYQDLRPGESTKRDVYAVFGQPHDVRYSDAAAAMSMWVYYKMHTRPSAWSWVPYVGLFAGGSAWDITTARFTFDGDRFVDMSTNHVSDYENSWAGLVRDVSAAGIDTRSAWVRAEMLKLGMPFDEELADAVSTLDGEPAQSPR